MAYNTKNIIRDAAGVPVPQYYNPTADAYEVLQGRNGANRVELYGPDGNPITVTSGRLETKVSELDITLSALRDALRGVDSKTISDLVTLLTAIKSTDGIKKITDTVSADVTDRAARALGKITADDNAIAALGALAAAAVTDPATSASVIALLKGLLKQLQGTGSGAAPVQLTGSTVPETQPIPTKKPAKLVTVVNALAITDTNNHTWSLIAQAGITEAECRLYSEFLFSFYDTHTPVDKTVKLLVKNDALPGFVSEGIIYNETVTTSGRLFLSPRAGETGASSYFKAIPALNGVYSDFQIYVQYSSAPTSGALTIRCLMR